MKKLLLFLIFLLTTGAAHSQNHPVRRQTNKSTQQTTTIRKKQTTSSNQINRNIDGIVLGVSTKQDVIRLLNNRSQYYDLHEQSDNNAVIVSNSKPNYMGVKWNAVAYKIYNNVVYQVTYIKRCENTGGALASNDYKQALEIIRNKYSIFKSPYSTDFFEDARTMIILNAGYPNDEQDLSLIFADSKIFNSLLN